MSRAAARAACLAALLPALNAAGGKQQPVELDALVIEQDGGLLDPPHLLAAADADGLDDTADEEEAAAPPLPSEEEPLVARRPHLRPRASLASSASDVTMADDAPEDMYPRSHPLVRDALDGMDDQVGVLRRQLDSVKAGRQALQASEADASQNMQSGGKLRRTMAARASDIKGDEAALKRLQEQNEHLKVQHDKTDQRLRLLMASRMSRGESRLKHRKDLLAKSESEVERWTRLADQYKKTAIDTIQSRKVAVEAYEAAKQETLRAQQAEKAAKSKLEELTGRKRRDIESVRNADSRLRAAMTKEKEQEVSEKKEEESLMRTRGIFEEEKKRLDRALEAGQKRLSERMRKVEDARSTAETRLAEAKQQYTDWQTEQRSRVQELVAAKSKEIADREALSKQRAAIMHRAEEQVGSKAVAESGFDDSDWAWSESGARGPDGEDVEQVSLDD